MIWLKDKNIVLVTPPKTGSTALHEALCEGGSGIYVMGPCWGFVEKHTWVLPLWAKGASVGVVVRNPWARLSSFYRHHFKYEWPHFGSFDEWYLAKRGSILDGGSWFDPISCEGGPLDTWPEGVVINSESLCVGLAELGVESRLLDRRTNVSVGGGERINASLWALLELLDVYRGDFAVGDYEEEWDEWFKAI